MQDIQKSTVFTLPDDLLESIELKPDLSSHISTPEASEVTENARESRITDPTQKNILSCTVCGINDLSDLENRKQHVKSDWHRFNAKRTGAVLPSVSLDEFEQILDNLTESISGSESDDGSDKEEASKGQLEKAFQNSLRISENPQQENEESTNHKKSPIVWFKIKHQDLLSPLFLGIYRHLFPLDSVITKDQLLEYQTGNQKKPLQIAMFMLGGGHFAAMVATNEVSGKPPQSSATPKVVAQKTIHRYTTRRKQGGSQGAADNSKGGIHSAGSSLRRYNELALIRDIQQLFNDWKYLLDKCDLIFIRAIGASNRSIFFSQTDPLVDPKDTRLRTFPFTTKRATHSELLRCYKELVTPKVSNIDTQSLDTQQQELRKENEAKKGAERELREKQENERKLLTKHTDALLASLKANKLEEALKYLQTNALSINFRFHPLNVHTHTSSPLHYAVAQGNTKLVARLLREGADPTVQNGNSKTPYEISSSNREVRDEFSIARYELGEETYDWEMAKVGSAKSRDQIEKLKQKAKARSESQKEEREQQEAQRRQEAIKKIKEQEKKDYDANNGKGYSLGINPLRKQDDLKSLSPEMRQRIEREKRATAAMKRLQKQ
ncbi:Cdc48p-Npl4p-Vms1p AAA ATPase complex subunit [Schizosaccharomyces osmophilus]|uniref:Cdc48p-Npl4p-Vms1p AAA ATPase complex subunit n=1 Tax=Schizosaccharomyces osmophilus TaxID=2545709 RepID=A0AAE9WEK1_9SCHI|nr:Cdc48p-Npl4p-Vms1p AAA ATPase complex subunit [Schizosaccharomyces osmophilus]WBW74902.1 Cdc48p-Npl4p-Vms1p AAA ATPase complex subunit [Schizosaccharomyces osmophilus]